VNKFLCKAVRNRGKFKRIMCQDCTYTARCIDYQEYKFGNADELRDSIHASEDVSRDHIGKI
jgi:hypothetical protein